MVLVRGDLGRVPGRHVRDMRKRTRQRLGAATARGMWGKGRGKYASVERHAGGDGASLPSNHAGVEGARVLKWGESGTVTTVLGR